MATEDQGAAGLSKKVQLSLSAKDLPNLDTLSKSDPMVVLFVERKWVLSNWLEDNGWSSVALRWSETIWIHNGCVALIWLTSLKNARDWDFRFTM